MEKINLEPIDDKVIIKPQDPETITSGGVFLPESAQPEVTCGIVVAVGPGLRNFQSSECVMKNGRIPMAVKLGDIVYYPKFGAHKFEYEDKEYVIIKEGDLFAIKHKKSFDISKVDKEKLDKAISETKQLKNE